MLLIDVNEAKRQLQNSKIDDPTSGSAGWRMAHNVILDILNNLPAVDAAPVVHGRFIIDREKDVIRCSVCDYETTTLIPYVCDGVNWVPFFERKYCGNCGAKMDGEKDG